MSWNSTAALLAFTFFGVGSLVYLLLLHSDENEDQTSLGKTKTTVLQVKIPKESAAIVIGRGGNKIREVESKADVKIIIKDSPKPNEDYKICIIKGTPEASQYAESLIHELIVGQPLIETYEMLVPAYTCGAIIGKNGDNIRLISRNSNTKILIENGCTSPVSLERKITIKGFSEQIALAKSLIEQKIEEDARFRNAIEMQMSNRPPRNKAKYLLAAKGKSEEADSHPQKEKFVATSQGLVEVYVSAIESPDRLWVQMMGSTTVELDRLVEQMTDYYTVTENRIKHSLREVKSGQLVAAPFKYDEKWYRAQIQEIKTDSSDSADNSDVLLYYVDYGDSSHCKKLDLCELRTDFLRLRFQAIECMLAKVKPRSSTWPQEAIDYLEDLTHVAMWKSLMAKVHTYKDRPTRVKRDGSPVPCVELYDVQGETTVNVAEELVTKGFAVWENDEESESASGCKAHEEKKSSAE